MARKQAANDIAQVQHQRSSTGSAVPDLSKVRLEPIDALALDAFEQWEQPFFAWHEITHWKEREPSALDVAIWFEDQLCGLCFANPNKKRRRLKVVRLEGRQGTVHPLSRRIGALAMIVVEQYAQYIGSVVLEIQEPLKGAIPVYLQLGFGFDEEGRLVKTLEKPVS